MVATSLVIEKSLNVLDSLKVSDEVKKNFKDHVSDRSNYFSDESSTEFSIPNIGLKIVIYNKGSNAKVMKSGYTVYSSQTLEGLNGLLD